MTEQAPDTSRRRRAPRWLIVLLVVIVALPLAGAAALKAMFPPERLREIAEPQLEKRIARDVSLGDVRLKVFPNIAIRLADVRIANPPAGFTDEAAIRMDALDLRLELLPLLRRQFRLSQVRLVGPRIRYEVAPDGTNNLSGLLVSDTTAAEDGGDAAPPAGSSFDVDDLVVAEGRVAWLDLETRRAIGYRLDGRLNVTPGERAGGPLASEGAFALDDGLMVAAGRDTTRLPDVRVDYRAILERDASRIAVPELEVRVAGLALSGDASSRVDTTGVRTVRAELASDEFDLGEALAGLPAGMVADTLDVDGTGRLQLRYGGAVGSAEGLRLDGTAELANVSLATPGRGNVAQAVAGTARFTTERLSVPDVRGRVFGRPFEARIELEGLGDEAPMVRGHFSGAFELAQVNDFREGEPLPVEGDASAEIDFAGPAQDVSRWTLSGPVRLSDVTWAAESLPRPAEVASATVQLTGAGLRGDGIPVRVGGSDLTVSFSSAGLVRHYLTDAAARGPAPLVEFSARSSRLATEDLRKGPTGLGYSDLLKARLAGAQVEGRPPEAIAAERYHRPDLAGYRASGTVSIAEWVNPPTSARDVSFRVDLADGRVEISQVAGTVYGGQLSGGVTIDLTATPPFELAYDLHLRGARAGALLERWTRLGSALSGAVDFDITGAAPLDDAFLPLTAGFVADGRASFVDGRFDAFGLTDALQQRLNLSPDRIRGFKDLGGPFEIRDGQFVVRNWTFGAGDVQGAVSGAAGLGGALNLDLAMRLPPQVVRNLPVGDESGLGALIGQITGTGTGEPIPLRLTVGGTMRDPAFRIDTEALASSLRGRATDAGRQRVEQEARDRLEDAAGGLLDRLRGGRADTTGAVGADSTTRDTTDGGDTP